MFWLIGNCKTAISMIHVTCESQKLCDIHRIRVDHATRKIIMDWDEPVDTD